MTDLTDKDRDALKLLSEGMTPFQVHRKLGITRWRARTLAQGLTPSRPASAGAGTMGLEEFRAAHDKSFIVPKRIQEALDSLGPDKCMYESDFIRKVNVSTNELAQYRDMFAAFWLPTTRDGRRRVWAGSKEFAEELRGLV